MIHPPPGRVVDRRDLRRAFLPIYRISREALACTHAAHQSGWRGHFEVLVPTVLRLHGLSVQDLNEVTPCYQGHRQEPCEDTHLQSTIRFKPGVSLYEFANRDSAPLLFHPVKEW